jgi:Tfp pilus assembly protein PilE
VPLKEKKKSVFSIAEFIVIAVMLLLIIVFFVLRLDPANNRSQVAQAKSSLKKIHALEKEFHQKNGYYGDLTQISFKVPKPSHMFEYSISLFDDRAAYQATAQEKEGADPLNNNVPGDQLVIIDQNGYLSY